MSKSNQRGDVFGERSKKFSSGQKILLFFLLAFISFIWLWYLHSPSSTEKYDNLDKVSYATFTRQTTAEVNNSLDQNLDEFFGEITSIKSMFNAVTDWLHITSNEKESFVKELWQKHINAPIDSIVTSRVKMLVDDMYRNNNQCISDLKTAGVNVQGFEHKIRDDMVNSMESQGIRISSGAVSDATINSAISFSVGTLVASSAALLKTNWYTFVLGIIIDAFVSETIDSKLNGDLKNDMKRQIKTALDEALNGKNGLFVKIKQGMDKFHAERAEEIRNAI